MKTKHGKVFVSQFLKKGESIQGYDYTADKDGAYANSTLKIGAASIGSSRYGLAYIYHKESDGKKGSIIINGSHIVTRSDVEKLGKNQNYTVEIYLNKDKERSSKEWAITIGHEAFGHHMFSIETLELVISAMKNGATGKEITELISWIQEESGDIDEEHDDMNNGDNQTYKEYTEELEKDEDKDEKTN